MENQFDVVRARFAALSKEKDNLGKVVLDLRAVIADQGEDMELIAFRPGRDFGLWASIMDKYNDFYLFLCLLLYI